MKKISQTVKKKKIGRKTRDTDIRLIENLAQHTHQLTY